MDLRAAEYAVLLTVSVIVPYFVTGLYCMYNDLSGNWVSFDLRGPSAPRRTVKNYTYSLPSQMLKLFFILPMSFYLVLQRNGGSVEFGTLAVSDAVPQTCLLFGAFVVHECYVMAIHYTIHSPWLYRRIHKLHHASLVNTNALTTWNETYVEFIVQEAGVLVLLILIFPIKPELLILYFASHGHSVAIQHCGFFVNSFIDARYHYNHHKHFNHNYADWEFLDWLFGTRWVEA